MVVVDGVGVGERDRSVVNREPVVVAAVLGSFVVVTSVLALPDSPTHGPKHATGHAARRSA